MNGGRSETIFMTGASSPRPSILRRVTLKSARLLALDGEWQKVDRFRILMGDEVSRRTKKAFVEGLERIKHRLDVSLEIEKKKNDFLVGVPAICRSIRSGKINCRVYRKDKFHAKTYITHARQAVLGSFGLVDHPISHIPGLRERRTKRSNRGAASRVPSRVVRKTLGRGRRRNCRDTSHH